MYKIYRNKNGMLALVDEHGRGTWVHSAVPILTKIDVADGWVEQRCVDVDEPEA